MRIRDLKLGQWVRVIYDGDVATVDGARGHRPLVLDGLDVQDGIVIETDHRDDPKPLAVRIFFPRHGTDVFYDSKQLVKAGKMLHTMDTGLND